MESHDNEHANNDFNNEDHEQGSSQSIEAEENAEAEASMSINCSEASDEKPPVLEIPLPGCLESPRKHIRRMVQESEFDDHDSRGEQPIEVAGSSKRVYIRRKRTPEEVIAYEHEALQTQMSPHRFPGPPGKRGRRPVLYSNSVEPISRTEAARRTGRPTVVHPSGVEFAIPISLEAHPIPLSDTIPDNSAYDILRDDKGLPYCTVCHCVLKSWHAMEYHIMSVHLKYKPYRCMFCVKEYFFTEDECQSHLKSNHAGKPLHFIRELKEDKEIEAMKYFQAVFVMIREGEELTDDRVVNIQQSAFSHMQKFHRMRFKVPEVVARQRSQRDATAQTFVTMASPQTMVTAPLQQKSFQREIEYRNGSQLKMVRLVSSDFGGVMPDHGRFVIERDMEVADGGEYDQDQIDVVDHELDHHHPDVHY